jgi:hypothetical protein
MNPRADARVKPESEAQTKPRTDPARAAESNRRHGMKQPPIRNTIRRERRYCVAASSGAARAEQDPRTWRRPRAAPNRHLLHVGYLDELAA